MLAGKKAQTEKVTLVFHADGKITILNPECKPYVSASKLYCPNNQYF
jgi:hypothetical protein